VSVSLSSRPTASAAADLPHPDIGQSTQAVDEHRDRHITSLTRSLSTKRSYAQGHRRSRSQAFPAIFVALCGKMRDDDLAPAGSWTTCPSLSKGTTGASTGSVPISTSRYSPPMGDAQNRCLWDPTTVEVSALQKSWAIQQDRERR
jgi:hypothetical protein